MPANTGDSTRDSASERVASYAAGGPLAARRAPGGMIASVDAEAISGRVERVERAGAGMGEDARLDHIGIAVKSIAVARGFYETLGLKVTAEETIEQEQVKTAMLPLGETRLELLEATAESSVIAKFIAKQGEGLHHIAIHVADVDAAFAQLKKDGARIASQSIQTGAGGHRYFFVHPSSAGGVLVEIVGDVVSVEKSSPIPKKARAHEHPAH